MALETEGVLHDPAPWVALTTYADFFINYKVGFCTKDYETSAGIRNEFATRLWYAAKRHNLTIPYPIQTEYEYQKALPTVQDKSVQVNEILRSIPSLSLIAPVLADQLHDKVRTAFSANAQLNR